jgi:hypothetical protein
VTGPVNHTRGLAVGLCAAALAACGLDLRGLGELPGDGGTVVDATMVDVLVTAEGGAEAQSDGAVDAALDALQDATQNGDVLTEAEDDALQGDSDTDGPNVQTDAAPDVVDAGADACEAGGPEDCSNGVDDNCNGLVDCADPSCATQGFVCAPSVPAGWSLVAYVPTTRPTCPSGWGSSAPNVEDPDGGSTCACTCGAPHGNPCVQGTLSLSLGQNECGCAQVQDVPLVSDGLCDPIGRSFGQPCGGWGDGKVAALAPAPVACAEVHQLPPITYAAQGETCLPLEPAGAGCATGGACLPQPAPATACIEQSGVQTACPAGFTQLHVVYPPGNVVDGRQCGTCGCMSTATSCNSATVTLYDDGSCTKNGVGVQANGNCNGLNGDPTDAGWFIYTATPNTTACAGAATSPLDGGLAVTNPRTICCP